MDYFVVVIVAVLRIISVVIVVQSDFVVVVNKRLLFPLNLALATNIPHHYSNNYPTTAAHPILHDHYYNHNAIHFPPTIHLHSIAVGVYFRLLLD